MKEEAKIFLPVSFVLPLKVNSKLSLNSIYSGSHWRKRQKQAEQIHEAVKLTLLSQRVPKLIFEKPVNIEFHWNSMLDLDNHGYLTKLIIDGLKGYLIRDDTKKYVREIHHAYWLGKGVKISILEMNLITT